MSGTKLRILNQMAGPMTWELAVDLAAKLGPIDLLTGHPDTLAKGSQRGVHLHPTKPYQRGSNLRRFGSWLRYTSYCGYWLLRHERSTPVLVFSNPPITIWMCCLLNRLMGLRYAVMVHDIYPNTIERMGILSPNNVISRTWRLLNRIAYQRAEVVMTLGKHMASHVAQQCDPAMTAAGEIIIVEPWADATKLGNRSKTDNWFAEKHGQSDKLTIMYSGNMGRGHDIESILDAARKLEDQLNVAFMLIGAGPKWDMVQSLLIDGQPPNITLLPWQAESDLPYTLTTADIGIVSLETELTGLAVPSKAFYFLAAGVPIIAICNPHSELADIVHEFQCGQVIEPGNSDAIVHQILDVQTEPELLNKWRNGARAARDRYARAMGTAKFYEVIQKYLILMSATKATRIRNAGLDHPTSTNSESKASAT